MHALTPGHRHTHNESPLKTLLPRRPRILFLPTSLTALSSPASPGRHNTVQLTLQSSSSLRQWNILIWKQHLFLGYCVRVMFAVCYRCVVTTVRQWCQVIFMTIWSFFSLWLVVVRFSSGQLFFISTRLYVSSYSKSDPCVHWGINNPTH